ncbi:MAG: acetyl-CoA carboxylase biotin carboxyl carrier protein subunit [Candidatus Aegiribacteria sp.]|nr:acetyl-CoA carboxylase biotin carboxyl carrier protein subunit [Candidatus Aegiribacteria sp.]
MESKLSNLNIDGTEYSTEIPEGSLKAFDGMPDLSEVRAFIPGLIIDILVSEGDSVKPRDMLLLLEAMKMHNEICSSISGIVSRIHVSKGDTVKKDQLLVEISRF